jgi:hypothetical protein
MSHGSSCVNFAIAIRKGGEIYSMANIAKLNIQKATVCQLFRVVIKAIDEIHEASFTHRQIKRSYKVDNIMVRIFRAKYVQRPHYGECQGISRHQHVVWPGIGKHQIWLGNHLYSSLLSGMKYDQINNPYPIPQTMAGREIDVDLDEFKDWYHSITRFPPAAIFDAQHKISEILNKYFEEYKSANHQGRAAIMLWRDGGISRLRLCGGISRLRLWISWQKVKSHLQTQLSEELCNPITDYRSYIEVRDPIALLVSMVKMTYCLPYKYEDHTTAIMFIDAQLERSTHMHHLLENRIS